MTHICFVAEGYPTADNPIFTFVRQLICAIADKGVHCSIIAPQSISKNIIRSKKKRPLFWQDKTAKGNLIDVYQPTYISFSNYKIGHYPITLKNFNAAVIKGYRNIKSKPDILYAHFWHCGIALSNISQKENIPLFVASGECEISVCRNYPQKYVNQLKQQVKGVICVSSKNYNESLGLKLADKNIMTIIPNAIDHNLFYKKDSSELRHSLNIKNDDFTIIFTGFFNDRKGAQRVALAISELKDKNIKSIFIGSGTVSPNCEGIVFCDKLPHSEIVNYLNAADVFVLPTKAEGCCNAIIEAMACGLPIISSNLDFNNEILNDKNSIRIDPENITEIANAILKLKDDKELRNSMVEESLKIAKNLNIDIRSQKVLDFINDKLEFDKYI